MAVLDPDVVLRADRDIPPAGAVLAPHGRPFAVMGFTVKAGKIAEIDVAADPARLRRIDLGVD
jgi:hypothetical protein